MLNFGKRCLQIDHPPLVYGLRLISSSVQLTVSTMITVLMRISRNTGLYLFNHLNVSTQAKIHPTLQFYSLLYMVYWRCGTPPQKRRVVVVRFSDRLKRSQLSDAELAVDYLHEKYSHNLVAATKQK